MFIILSNCSKFYYVQKTWYPPTQETRKEHGILQHKKLAKNMVSLKKETDKEHVILQSRKIHIYVPSLEQVV